MCAILKQMNMVEKLADLIRKVANTIIKATNPFFKKESLKKNAVQIQMFFEFLHNEVKNKGAMNTSAVRGDIFFFCVCVCR